jgi:hypothetical protein
MPETWQILTGAPPAVVGEVVFDGGVTTYRSLAPLGELFLRMVRDVVMSPETHVSLEDGSVAGGPHDRDAARLSAALAQVNESGGAVEVRWRPEDPQVAAPLDPHAKAALVEALTAALATLQPAMRTLLEARVLALAAAIEPATTGAEVLSALTAAFDVGHDDPMVAFLHAAIVCIRKATPGAAAVGHPLRWVVEHLVAAFTAWRLTSPVT